VKSPDNINRQIGSMDIRHLIGALIALTFSTWASFSFFRGSITGAPPLYSRGWFQRGLHFAAGIIFGALAIGTVLKIAGKRSDEHGGQPEGTMSAP